MRSGMIAAAPIPVTVVTGFLGAGKTTLVNCWLAGVPRGAVAVIVNEVGSIGVDGALLAERARQLVEITGGCVCCATQAELVQALEHFASLDAAPERILIETSGAASPAGVLRTIARGGRTGAFALDGVVAVVDPTRIDALGAEELALEQLGYADIVVLSRSDVCDHELVSRAAEIVAARSAALCVEVPPVPALEALLDLRRADFAPAREVFSASSTHHPIYESVSLTVEGDVDGDRFADFMESELARFAGRLLRTKGILAVAGAPARMIVQGVADLVEVTFGAPWGDAPRTSRLVVVGFGLDRAALARSFEACAAREHG